MRIAVLTSLYPSCTRPHEGIFAERRWIGMRERGHAVSVVHPLPWTPWPVSTLARFADFAKVPPRETRAGIEIRYPRYLHVPKSALSNARAFARAGVASIAEIASASSSGELEVVVCDYAWPAAAAAPLFAQRKIACVISGRGSDVLQVAGEAGLGSHLRSYLKSAGHWCAVSRDLCERMDRLADAPGRGVLVPNGVDLELFRIQEKRAVRRKLAIEDGVALVLVVGHWIERKDPLLALRAFAKATRESKRNARLVFIGRGPLGDSIRATAASEGVADRVQLLGEKTPAELADWYSAADLLLLTSSREGRPNVVLEALASGLAVVATDAGGTAELLAGLDGALATSRDPRSIAVAIERMLASPPKPADLRKRVESLSWSASLDALEGCLAKAVAERRGARA